MDAKDAKELVTSCMDIVLTVVLAASKDQATALRGVAALHKDMIANVEKFYRMCEDAE